MEALPFGITTLVPIAAIEAGPSVTDRTTDTTDSFDAARRESPTGSNCRFGRTAKFADQRELSRSDWVARTTLGAATPDAPQRRPTCRTTRKGLRCASSFWV